MFFIQENLELLALNLEIDNLWNFEVKTDPSSFTVGEMQSKVLVERSSCDKEEVDFETGDMIIILILNCQFKKLTTKFIFCHFKFEIVGIFPLYR